MQRDLVRGDAFAQRYEILGELGRGAYGVVYDARDSVSGARVAVKLLRKNRISLSSSRWREASSLRRLHLPGVPSMLDEGHVDGTPFVVMEFVAGESFPTPRNPTPWAELRPLTVRLLEILALVHGEGVVHGDLKPSNVMVVEGKEVVLLDFGLATSATANAHESQDGSKGSPIYMAPELFQDQPRSPQSDLFAVGTMLFEALSGRPFFMATSLVDWVRLLTTEGPPKLATVLDDADTEACRLVDALLESDLDARPGSATEALALLHPSSTASVCLPLVAEEGTFLTQQELADLFAGPEHGFHLKSEPARILFERTLGHTVDVVEELEAWQRAGMAHLESAQLRISPRGLQLLRDGLRPRPPLPISQVSEPESVILVWVRLAEPVGTAELVEFTGRELESVERTVEALERRRLIRHSEEGWCRVRDVDVLSHCGPRWIENARRRILERTEDPVLAMRLALVVGDEGLAEIAIRAARHLAEKGETLAAHATYRSGLTALRSQRPDDLPQLLRAWGRQTVFLPSVDMYEEVLWAWGDQDEHLRGLLELRRMGLTTPGKEYAEALAALAPFDDPELEAARLLSIFSSTRWFDEVERSETNARLLELVDRVRPEIRRRILHRLRIKTAFDHFLRGEFGVAARLQREAAQLAPNPRVRLSTLVNAGWAYVDAFDFGEAIEIADSCLDETVGARHPDLELHLMTLRRYAVLRSGGDLEPDDELLWAAREVGFQPLITVSALLESVIAWRGGDRDRAREVVRGVAARWTASSKNWPALLVAHFHAFLEGRDLAGTPHETGMEECPLPRLKAQMLVMSSYTGDDGSTLRQRALELVPTEHHDVMLECFALNEIDRLGDF